VNQISTCLFSGAELLSLLNKGSKGTKSGKAKDTKVKSASELEAQWQKEEDERRKKEEARIAEEERKQKEEAERLAEEERKRQEEEERKVRLYRIFSLEEVICMSIVLFDVER